MPWSGCASWRSRRASRPGCEGFAGRRAASASCPPCRSRTAWILLARATPLLLAACGGDGGGGGSGLSLTVSTHSLSVDITNNSIADAFKDSASLGPGTYADSVGIAYTVNPSTVMLDVAAGPQFTLTVAGKNFTARSKVLRNGQECISAFVSATQPSAQIGGSDTAVSGTASVAVSDATCGLSGRAPHCSHR
jgi:hypothetical protein